MSGLSMNQIPTFADHWRELQLQLLKEAGIEVGSIMYEKKIGPQHAKLYDVSVVSPRNYFLNTPLLPGVTVGTVEARALIEPTRRLLPMSQKTISIRVHVFGAGKNQVVKITSPKDNREWKYVDGSDLSVDATMHSARTSQKSHADPLAARSCRSIARRRAKALRITSSGWTPTSWALAFVSSSVATSTASGV